MTLRVTLPVLAGLAVITPVKADTITQTIGFSEQQPTFYDQDEPIQINFAPFDPSLGTLTDVTIKAYGIYVPAFGYIGSGSPAPATETLTSVAAIGPHGFDLGTQVATLSYGAVPGMTCGGCGYTGVHASFDVTADFGASLPAPYYPTPAVSFNLVSYPDPGGVSGASDAQDRTFSAGDLVVTYTYIPEPSSALLTVGGLVLLWFAARQLKA